MKVVNYIYKRKYQKIRFKSICLFSIIWIFTIQCSSIKKTKTVQYKLIDVDSSYLKMYYIITFKNKGNLYRVFSLRDNLPNKDSCTVELKLGKKYLLNIGSMGGYYMDKESFRYPLPDAISKSNSDSIIYFSKFTGIDDAFFGKKILCERVR